MVPQDAVSWDFDGIMSALRDPAQRLPLLKEVENGAPKISTPSWNLRSKVGLKRRGHRWRIL